jgi:hypothetical protein
MSRVSIPGGSSDRGSSADAPEASSRRPRHVQGNQKLRSQTNIIQEPIEPLFSLFRPRSQGQASSQGGFREPAVSSPSPVIQGDQCIGHQSNILQNRDPDHPSVSVQKLHELTKQIIRFNPFSVTR